jgi:hypothetical protein
LVLLNDVEYPTLFVKDALLTAERFPQGEPNQAAIKRETVNQPPVGLWSPVQDVLIPLVIICQRNSTVMGEVLNYLKMRRQELLKPVQV